MSIINVYLTIVGILFSISGVTSIVVFRLCMDDTGSKTRIYTILLTIICVSFLSSLIMYDKACDIEKEINTPVQAAFLSAIEGKEIVDIDAKTETVFGSPIITEVFSVTYRDKDVKHTFVFKDIDKDTTLGKEIDIEDSDDGSYHVALEEDEQIILYIPAPPEGPVLISQ